MKNESWIVHKFGGTSLADAEKINNAARIVIDLNASKTAVVVSAMSGVTNKLISLTELATKGNSNLTSEIEKLKQQHLTTIKELLPATERTALVAAIQSNFNDLEDILRGVQLIRECSERTLDFISGLGEVWSAQLFHAKLLSLGKKSQWLDARKVLTVEPAKPNPNILFEISRPAVDEFLSKNPSDILVITGYVAKTEDNIPTTLGRNGSDFSASIFGNLLDAKEVIIWTDVDGVMSANPRQVPDAVVIPSMSYQEAMELAYFGAKVLHPATMAPVLEKQIPIYIKNSFNHHFSGTRISNDAESNNQYAIKGFTTIDDISLINVEGTGMIGVPGISARLFGALHEHHISVILISQASSEHSICFAIPQKQSKSAKKVIENIFHSELQHGKIQTVEVQDKLAILAAVGDQMAGHVGVSARFFGSLGKAGVNIKAIAQGSSERNISVVISDDDKIRALRSVHSGFYLSKQTISIGIIGLGTVGGTLVDQISGEMNRLKKEFNIDFRVRGLMNSKSMLLSDKGIPLKDWRKLLDSNSSPANLDEFVRHIHADYLPHTVLIDCTSSNVIAHQYTAWLKSGIHVITPNKKANTFPFEEYKNLREAGKTLQRHYLYETTVGAGLPIIGTLRDLVQTGDEIIEIEGILSGTLSYIFTNYTGEKPFSEIVREAKANGYTEPDPRDDLSGTDVARKIVILAREIGLKKELEEIPVYNLVPKSLREGSIDNYMNHLSEYDSEMKLLLDDAKNEGKVLRYVGSINKAGVASVELKKYPLSHPFARLSGSDNIVAFRTRRYNNQPLFVQGPGAGPDVTAGGVFADLLRLSTYLGATI